MDLRMEPRTELYPAIEPYDSGMLPLDGIHTMYWEVSGNPLGVPMLFHPWWVVLPCYGVAAFVLGLVLAVVFQLAHCVEEAQFPVPKTIESFDFKVQPSINQPLVRELLQGDYITKKENVLLVGNAGTGKTHLATALGFAACSQGKRVRFYTTTGLVTQLLEAREERTLQRLLKQLDRQDLILLDELGYVPFSKAGAELLFDVVSRAYERTSLIVTTNLPFEQWTEVLGSERLTGALLDRLTHRVHILEANGASYRLADAKKRLKRS
jgi:DNA replication protein DnaC